MKKLLSLLLVMLMLITTLASCSLVEQFFPKKDTVDREVTEEEWNANMNITNFEMYSYFTVTQSGKTEIIENIIFQYTDNAYCIINPTNGRVTDIGVLKDGVWYEVDKRENGYIGYDMPEYTQKTMGSLMLSSDITFANCTYNAELGAYIKQANPEDEFIVGGEIQEYRVYFENKVIVKYEMVGHYESDDGSRVDYIGTVEFRNIGTTVVDIPEFTIPSEDTVDREVTEEEWNANMLVTNYEQHVYFKYTMNGEVINSPETPWGIWKYTENAMYSTVNGEFNSAYVLKDGRWYQLIRNSHGEDSIEYTAYLDEDYNQALMEVEYKYSDFVYDADLGAYVIFVGDEGEAYGLGTLYDAKLYVYFENNVIVKYESSYYALSEDGTRIDVLQTSIIKNIGTTVVDIPEFTIPE